MRAIATTISGLCRVLDSVVVVLQRPGTVVLIGTRHLVVKAQSHNLVVGGELGRATATLSCHCYAIVQFESY